MMYENIDDNGREVCCRHMYDCEWCGEPINKGEIGIVRVYKYDGDFNSSHMHPECFDALKRSLPEMWDGSFNAYEQDRGQLINFS